MGINRISFVFFLAAILIGLFSINAAWSLDFADWSRTWFKVRVTETGKAGPVVSVLNPQGGKVVVNNERIADVYVKIERYEIAGDPPYFEVGYCSWNGTVWSTQKERLDTPGQPLIWPVVGGEPKRFLTLFNFERIQSQNITEEYWIPLEVQGTEAAQTVGEVNTASLKNLGGIFLEEIGTPEITQRGVGSVNFTGSLIKGTANVEKMVPEGCRLTAP
jgi:hypothetical protein